jgi:hypothetical protein
VLRLEQFEVAWEVPEMGIRSRRAVGLPAHRSRLVAEGLVATSEHPARRVWCVEHQPVSVLPQARSVAVLCDLPVPPAEQ